MSDQVPELMYAQLSPVAGTAATAAAVSWVAVATTGTDPRPVSAAMAARSGPRTVPGATSDPRRSVERPSFCTSGNAQERVAGSSIWLVLASVTSLTSIPVHQ